MTESREELGARLLREHLEGPQRGLRSQKVQISIVDGEPPDRRGAAKPAPAKKREIYIRED